MKWIKFKNQFANEKDFPSLPEFEFDNDCIIPIIPAEIPPSMKKKLLKRIDSMKGSDK